MALTNEQARKITNEVIPLAEQEAAKNFETLRQGVDPGSGDADQRKTKLNELVLKKALRKVLTDRGQLEEKLEDGKSLENHIGGTQQFKNKAKNLDQARKDASEGNSDGEQEEENGDEGTQLDGDEAREERRFQEQCFLIDNFEKICAINVGRKYKGFTCIDADPARVVSKITAAQRIKPFVDMKTFEMAGMHPKLRFYKVEYTDPRAGTVRTREKEIRFAAFNSRRSINEALSNERGRHDGVGIKKFSWSFIGQNPAEVENNITAKLVLSFRNLEDIDPANLPRNEASVLDMILYKDKEGKYRKKRNIYNVLLDPWDPAKYTIRVVCGWGSAEPNDDLISDPLRRYLRSQNTVMNLVLLEHRFNFKDDGSGTLEIEFQGVIDAFSKYATSDILRSNKQFTRLIQERAKDINAKQEKVNSLEQEAAREQAEQGFGGYVLDGAASFYEAAVDGVADLMSSVGGQSRPQSLAGSEDADPGASARERSRVAKEQLEKAEKQLEKAIEDDKMSRYRLLLERIDPSKMYFIDLSRETLGELNSLQRSRKQSAILRKAGGKPADKNSKRRPDFTIQTAEGFGQVEANRDALQKVAETGQAVEGESDQDKEERQSRAPNEADEILGQGKPEGHFRVNFLFLGDLIESAFTLLQNVPAVATKRSKTMPPGRQDPAPGENMEHALDSPPTQSGEIRYLLGDITFLDPVDNSLVSVNLADIPISLSLFLQWFNNKCIRTQRESWLINQFIRDVVTDLVLAALGPNCFLGYDTSPQMQMSYIEGASGRKKKYADRVPKGRVTDVNDIEPYPVVNTDSKISTKVYSYLYIYSNTAPPPGLSSNVRKDSNAGIYHFFVGRNAGILKSISYSKVDQPFVREARSELDGVDPISAQTREPYKVDIKTIGAPVFRPGQYVFVHPRVSGGNVAKLNSITMKVGLGGYVFITQVNNIIEPGRYETTLTGINNGIFSAKINSPKKPRRVKYAPAGVTSESGAFQAQPETEPTPAEAPDASASPQDRTTTS